MKKYFFLLLIPFFFSCGPSDEELKLKSQVDSLMSTKSEDEATIDEYLKAFNDIQQNLNDIKTKEKIITTKTVGDVELEKTDVDGITNDIIAIHELMQENKKKLSYLRNKISKSKSKNKELNKTIKLLNENIEQKDLEISNLTMLLEQKDFDISALNIKIATMDSTLAKTTYNNIQKDSTITVKEDALHVGYFIIGDKKSLKAKGVLKKDGGFMGIGGNTKVKMNDKEFTKIDTREIMEFALNKYKKVKLITDHPKGSYGFKKDGKGKYTNLVIINADNFWKMSKYLVVQVK